LGEPDPGRELVQKDRPRKYNNPEDLYELCRGFLECKDTDMCSAIEYCRSFLALLSEKPPTSGAVVSSRAKSR
jgi:hypothetical protein